MHLVASSEHTGSARSDRCGKPLCRATSRRSRRQRNRRSSGPSPADARRTQSLQKFCQPHTKFVPPLSSDFRNTSGLVAAKLEGDSTSSICRTENSTMASFCFATPRTPVVALCHHCCPEKRLRHQIEWRMFPLRPVEAPVLRLRPDQRPRSIPGRIEVLRSFEKPLSRRPALAAKSRSVAAATRRDAKASPYRRAAALPGKCRRSGAPASHEVRDRPDVSRRPFLALPTQLAVRSAQPTAGRPPCSAARARSGGTVTSAVGSVDFGCMVFGRPVQR